MQVLFIVSWRSQLLFDGMLVMLIMDVVVGSVVMVLVMPAVNMDMVEVVILTVGALNMLILCFRCPQITVLMDRWTDGMFRCEDESING